jgi:hypothetical protein
MESKSRDILRAVCAEQRAKGALTVEEIPACQWFALCPNEAVTMRPHPILGEVPICERCDERISALER